MCCDIFCVFWVLDSRNIKPKFDIQYSMSVVPLSEIFCIFVKLSNQHTYWWKCFRTVLYRKCGSFQEQKDYGQHSFIRLAYVEENILFSFSSYLSECGVLDIVYFCSGFSTTFYKIDEIGSTLSFVSTARVWGYAGKSNTSRWDIRNL